MTKDPKLNQWLETCPYEYDIIYDRSNAIDEQVDLEGQVDIAIYTRKEQ